MTTFPKISIVTPSLNQGQFIEDAILSVKNQDYPNFEHIIIDGGSTDNTLWVLKKYSHLIWVSEPDKGQSDALNKGFRKATGEIVGWLNADDAYLPGAFEKVSDFMRKHPEVDIAYGDYQIVDQNGKFIRNKKEIDFDRLILFYVYYVPSTAAFLRKRIFDDGNYLDANYHLAMDKEFFCRLAVKDYNFGHIKKVLALYRSHPQTKSSRSRNVQITESWSIINHYLFQQDELSVFNKLKRFLIWKYCLLLYRFKKLVQDCYF